MLIVVVIAVGVLIFLGRRRSAVLRQKFGSERRRAAGEFGDERNAEAEAELAARSMLTPEEEARSGSR